ncbi:MAG: hypothetical protein QXX97_07135 [Nitrososphaerota archaeon]
MKIKSQISLYVIIYSGIAIFLLSGFLIWIQAFILNTQREIIKKKLFAVAESGIEYYRWHLAHAPQDFTDGTNRPGPYEHIFYDRFGNSIGKFILDITPPPVGSTIVKIKSSGILNEFPNVEKSILVTLGIPSFAKYSVVVNDNIRFGEGTEVYGEIHSNQGIRFDGVAYNLVSSALTTYDDPDHTGPQEWAVHTHKNPVDPLPPTPYPQRPDVFKAGRLVGVPRVDFNGITYDLAKIKLEAQTNGVYIGPSNSYGYEIILKPDGTFDLYKVTRVYSDCDNPSWSIRNKTFIRNYQIPQNGTIFIEDHVWVSGQIKNKRVLIGAGKFPDIESERKNIIINQNLTYSNYNGDDVIGLIAQNNVLVGLKSLDNLKIDAALIAQNGFVGRLYYSSLCGSEYLRNSITIYGMIGTNKRYGFAWVCGNIHCSGYKYRTLIYDANLLYGPPPYFPLSTSFYEVLKWLELK